MRGRPALLVVGAALLLALLAVVSTSGPVTLLTEPSADGTTTTAPATIDAGEAPSALPTPTADKPAQDRIGDILATILKVVLVVVACVVLLILARALARTRSRPERDRDVDEFVPLPDVADVVGRHAELHLEALADGEPRNAIVGCWVRLESSVAEAGLPRSRAETSAEYTERILTAFAVDPAAIADLAGLYREARFSSHRLGERDRERAVRALQDLHHGLRVGTS